jgi:hypothetical protein
MSMVIAPPFGSVPPPGVWLKTLPGVASRRSANGGINDCEPVSLRGLLCRGRVITNHRRDPVPARSSVTSSSVVRRQTCAPGSITDGALASTGAPAAVAGYYRRRHSIQRRHTIGHQEW